MRQIASPVGRRHAEQLISNQKLVTNESRPAENSDSTVMQHRPTPSRRQSLNGRAPTRVEQQARGASPAQTGLTKWHWLLERPWDKGTGRPREVTFREALMVTCGYTT